MSSTTTKLNLFKYNTFEDRKSPYDIDMCLNDNWDKLDSFADYTDKAIEKLNAIFRIGQPIIRLDDYINEDFELRLEGGEVLKDDYPELFSLYQNTYGQPSQSNKFVLPDFRDRTFWGGVDFGYLSAGLPNIVGTYGFGDRQTSSFNVTGAFYDAGKKSNWKDGGGSKTNIPYLGFDADKGATYWNAASAGIYGNTTTVRPPSVKVRVVTIARWL